MPPDHAAPLDESVDADGYRRNVGIIVCNRRRQVLWAQRWKRDGWQFPQGGIRPNETARTAAFRELHEEVGLLACDVRLLGTTADWLRYEIPPHTRRPQSAVRGQKQRWFLFELLADDSRVRLDACAKPEFVGWRWLDYHQAAALVVEFKRPVYERALAELETLLPVAVE